MTIQTPIRYRTFTVWNSKFITASVPAGTDSSDVLYGYSSNVIISGLEGDDYLYGMDGDDTLDGVSFKYSLDSAYALERLSSDIKPGMRVGLVGRSGSGKSTITKLIEKLYILSEGTIYMDDIDIRHINPVWLRFNIGVVLQDDYLGFSSFLTNLSLFILSGSLSL